MVELLCTLAGIVAGIAVVTSLRQFDAVRSDCDAEQEDQKREQIRMVADQLRVISSSVAANVSAHNETVGQLSDRLSSSGEGNAPEQIIESIHEILAANQMMQSQLAEAQSQIAVQTEMIEKASMQARTDALTGLSNRRALDEHLKTTLASQGNNSVTALLLMDIDHFKNFNDTYGHITGDAVLSSFARAIDQASNEACFPARYGGEEFAVIISGDNLHEVVQTAANIRHFASEQEIAYDGLQLTVTASGGLCILESSDTLAPAYERADKCLYQSKKAGRNQGHWIDSTGNVHPFPPGEFSRTASENADLPQASNEDAFAIAGPANMAEPGPSQADPPQNSSRDNPASSAGNHESEVLELHAFLDRLEGCLDQLMRADLPGAGMLIEAVGLSEHEPSLATAGWDTTISLVQACVRGIDVVSEFRPFTLCVFLPGCSQDAAMERAAKIQANLNTASQTWQSGACPERLAISISQIESTDSTALFLNRLESALDDAIDAAPNEVVIPDGESSLFQKVSD